jgi:hypothetical protein
MLELSFRLIQLIGQVKVGTSWLRDERIIPSEQTRSVGKKLDALQPMQKQLVGRRGQV